MKKSIKNYELRETTSRAINRLLNEGRFSNKKAALLHITKLKKKCGYEGEFPKIYNQFLKFEKKYIKD